MFWMPLRLPTAAPGDATTRLKGRALLPSPITLARDAAAREELCKLAARLPADPPTCLPCRYLCGNGLKKLK